MIPPLLFALSCLPCPIDASVVAVRQVEEALEVDVPGLIAHGEGLLAEAGKATDAARKRELLAECLATLRPLDGISDSEEVCKVIATTALHAHRAGALETSLEAWEWLAEAHARTLPADHPNRLGAISNHANTLRQLGRIDEAIALNREAVGIRERTLSHDDMQLNITRLNLGVALLEVGDAEEAADIFQTVVDVWMRTLDSGHTNLLVARQNLASARTQLGDNENAAAIHAEVADTLARTLPADDHRLLQTRKNLAIAYLKIGREAEAVELLESNASTYARKLPEEHNVLVDARTALAEALRLVGNYERAHEMNERLLGTLLDNAPADHPLVRRTRMSLANAKMNLGDLAGARALYETAMVDYARGLPEGHPDQLRAKQNLAVLQSMLGDEDAARAAFEEVVEARRRIFKPDSPELLTALSNLARTVAQSGDHSRSAELQRSLLDSYERTLPEGHHKVLGARTALAHSLQAIGEADEAFALLDGLVEAYGESLSPGHPDVLKTRSTLATVLDALGDERAALEQLQILLESYASTVPAGHPLLCAMRYRVQLTSLRLGDEEAARTLLPDQLADLSGGRNAVLDVSPREARAVLLEQQPYVDAALFLTEPGDDDEEQRALQVSVLELVETRRHLATAALGSGTVRRDPELARGRLHIAELRRRLNDLVLGGPGGADIDVWRREIGQLSRERDDALQALRTELRERNAFVDNVDLGSVAKALPADGLAVGFLRYSRWRNKPDGRVDRETDDALLAIVIRPDGHLRRIELGLSAGVREGIRTWRGSLGASGDARGVPVDSTVEGDELELGRLLRRALIDPVLEEGTRTLYVCLDDFLTQIPLGALPLDDGGRLGDRVRVHYEVSFARLMEPAEGADGRGLLLVGDVDFDGPAKEDAGPLLAFAGSGAPDVPGLRAGPWRRWDELPGTAEELSTIAAIFQDAFGEGALTLRREQANKRDLYSAAPGRRTVHLATHGWFAPETVLSLEDTQEGITDDALSDVERVVKGLAPMTLCGLCLAGANRGRDELGRVSGLLTAEELCAYDLSACDLAVLSACETNVGERRAGQGILSLQSALHAAGARTTVTSLWKVGDEATGVLMERFYAALWLDDLPKHEALWQAKLSLREEGYPVRDWAAWVMTGDPD